MLFQVSEEHVPSIQHHSLGIKQNYVQEQNVSKRHFIVSTHLFCTKAEQFGKQNIFCHHMRIEILQNQKVQ